MREAFQKVQHLCPETGLWLPYKASPASQQRTFFKGATFLKALGISQEENLPHALRTVESCQTIDGFQDLHKSTLGKDVYVSFIKMGTAQLFVKALENPRKEFANYREALGTLMDLVTYHDIDTINTAMLDGGLSSPIADVEPSIGTKTLRKRGALAQGIVTASGKKAKRESLSTSSTATTIPFLRECISFLPYKNSTNKRTHNEDINLLLELAAKRRSNLIDQHRLLQDAADALAKNLSFFIARIIVPELRKTFLNMHTGWREVERRFLDNASDEGKIQIFEIHPSMWSGIKEEVKAWSMANWETWDTERPEWFTMHVISTVPDDFIPPRFLLGLGGSVRERRGSAAGSVGELMRRGSADEGAAAEG